MARINECKYLGISPIWFGYNILIIPPVIIWAGSKYSHYSIASFYDIHFRQLFMYCCPWETLCTTNGQLWYIAYLVSKTPFQIYNGSNLYFCVILWKIQNYLNSISFTVKWYNVLSLRLNISFVLKNKRAWNPNPKLISSLRCLEWPVETGLLPFAALDLSWSFVIGRLMTRDKRVFNLASWLGHWRLGILFYFLKRTSKIWHAIFNLKRRGWFLKKVGWLLKTVKTGRHLEWNIAIWA